VRQSPCLCYGFEKAQWNINPIDVDARDIEFVNVKDSNNIAATINVSNCFNAGNNTKWDFGQATLTWNGGASNTNWFDAGNWNLGFAPNAGDIIIIGAILVMMSLIEAMFFHWVCQKQTIPGFWMVKKLITIQSV